MANSEGALADANRSMDGINSDQSIVGQSVDGSEVTGRISDCGECRQTAQLCCESSLVAFHGE